MLKDGDGWDVGHCELCTHSVMAQTRMQQMQLIRAMQQPKCKDWSCVYSCIECIVLDGKQALVGATMVSSHHKQCVCTCGVRRYRWTLLYCQDVHASWRHAVKQSNFLSLHTVQKLNRIKPKTVFFLQNWFKTDQPQQMWNRNNSTVTQFLHKSL